MVLTGTGGTDFYPSSLSNGETIIVTSMVVVGALIWTQVLALFCDIASNSHPGLTEFRQQLDGLNELIRTNNLPSDMARRLREYLHQQRGVQLRQHTEQVLLRLSAALQIEVVLHCHRHWLDRIWFLKDIDELCRVRIAMSMATRVLAPGEVAAVRSHHPTPSCLVHCLAGPCVACGSPLAHCHPHYTLTHYSLTSLQALYARMHRLARLDVLPIYPCPFVLKLNAEENRCPARRHPCRSPLALSAATCTSSPAASSSSVGACCRMAWLGVMTSFSRTLPTFCPFSPAR